MTKLGYEDEMKKVFDCSTQKGKAQFAKECHNEKLIISTSNITKDQQIEYLEDDISMRKKRKWKSLIVKSQKGN